MLDRAQLTSGARFGLALQRAMAQARLTDPATIGARVASAQKWPKREDAPYDACVVRSWLLGDAMPSPRAFEAMLMLLGDLPQTKLKQLQKLQQEALPTTPPCNEVLTLFRHRRRITDLSMAELSTRLAEAGGFDTSGDSFAPAVIHQWDTGKAAIPYATTAVLDEILLRPPGSPGLQRVLQLQQIEQLPDMKRCHSIHDCLKQLRLSMGLSLPELGQQIGPHLPNGKALSNTCIKNWETNPGSTKQSSLPRFTDADLIRGYGVIMKAHGLGHWFTANEAKIRALYTVAKEVPPPMEPVPQIEQLPDMKRCHSIHDCLKQMRLAMGLSMEELSQQIGAQLPYRNAPTSSSIRHWETNPGGHRQSAVPRKNSFMDVDPIHVYGIIMKERGLGHWFNRHAEKIEALYQQALNKPRANATVDQKSFAARAKRAPHDTGLAL